MDELISGIAREIEHRLMVEVEASGRHLHLCHEDVERLFGKGAVLTHKSDLSQPGQFACNERVILEGPRGRLEKVIVLGPERPVSQVEVSLTDALALGITVPVRLSGDIKGTPGVKLIGPKGEVTLTTGLIAAQRHIHMTAKDAKQRGVVDGELVKLKCFSARPLIFEDVAVRVNDRFATYVHIDYDEANSAGFAKGCKGLIIK